jgi:hypothetical protein
MIDIVHGSPTHSSVIPLKSHGLDQIDSRAQARTEPQYSTHVSGNFGLEESNSHGAGLYESRAILNVCNGWKADIVSRSQALHDFVVSELVDTLALLHTEQ